MENNDYLVQINSLINLFDNWSYRARDRKMNISSKIVELKKQKSSQNKLINQYRFKYILNSINLKIKGSSIVKLSKKYAINKTSKVIKPKEVETQSNNEYFGSICDINKEITSIKKEISLLEVKLNTQKENRKETIKQLKFYKYRLSVINNYLDLLFGRVKQLSNSSNIIEKEIKKINNMK